MVCVVSGVGGGLRVAVVAAPGLLALEVSGQAWAVALPAEGLMDRFLTAMLWASVGAIIIVLVWPACSRSALLDAQLNWWRERAQLEEFCRLRPFHRDCGNLRDPLWQPPPQPRCAPGREEVS